MITVDKISCGRKEEKTRKNRAGLSKENHAAEKKAQRLMSVLRFYTVLRAFNVSAVWKQTVFCHQLLLQYSILLRHANLFEYYR